MGIERKSLTSIGFEGSKLELLDQLAYEENTSRAELVRKATDDLLIKKGKLSKKSKKSF